VNEKNQRGPGYYTGSSWPSVSHVSLPEGVTLARRTLGGYDVVRNGRSLGWVHHDQDDLWLTYERTSNITPGRKLGTYDLENAVKLLVQRRPQ
jgi:hypothetical protein